MPSDTDPAKRVGANDLSVPWLRTLVLPFREARHVGPIPVARFKDKLETQLDVLGFDTAVDFGPTETPIAEFGRNAEPGSARHSLEGIMVGERGLKKDREASRRAMSWILPLMVGGAVVAVAGATLLSTFGPSPLLVIAGILLFVVGLVSLPRIHSFESEIVYVWYGYDPAGWVTAYSVRAMERQMPTGPEVFDVRVGAGRVATADLRGKNMVGRTVRRVLVSSGDLDAVPKRVLDGLSGAEPLAD